MSTEKQERLATEKELRAMKDIIEQTQALGRLVVYHNVRRKDLREIARAVMVANGALKI